MKADKFIQQYGPIEMNKLKKIKDSDTKSFNSGSGGSKSPKSKSKRDLRSVGSNPDMRLGIADMRQWIKQEMKENPKIKPSELQKRMKKVLKSDGSSELDPKQEH